MKAIPVFMYHHVNRHSGDLVTLPPEGFENHLRILQERGFQSLFMGDLVEILRRNHPAPDRAVALTFDDGHLDNWVFAFPLLLRYRMKATLFVITSWMGEGKKRAQWGFQDPANQELPQIPRHGEVNQRGRQGDSSVVLNWEEARAMEASGLVDIQSHTHFHRDYFLPGERIPKLNPENKEIFIQDLSRSKEVIEEKLPKKCRFLSWPWGKYDAEALALSKEAGFEAAVTTEKGVNYPGSDPMTIKRIVAKSGEKSWFSSRLWIYSQRSIGHLYSRIAGKI